jgi:deazaflavin-dependent oxidoreductase (nitroreductase family)
MGLHTFAYRATNGRIGCRIPGVPAPILLLDHVGAKSGVKRTSPLSYIPDGDDVVLIAAKGGHPKHPAWLHNLKANPETIAQIRSEHRPVHARIATPEECGWPSSWEPGRSCRPTTTAGPISPSRAAPRSRP